MSVADRIREFWDRDAETYDHDPGHHPSSDLVRAAWRAVLEDLLPDAPARVLDVGAGTGFLSLLIAELGHLVTAVDISPGMLGRLHQKADAAGLQVDAVEGDAAKVPSGPFEVVISRHLLWTLLDPPGALSAWRDAAPNGTLVLIDRDWGDQGAGQMLRRLGHQALDMVRSSPPAHHSTYDEEITRALPLGEGPRPETLVRLVTQAGWRVPRIRRLSDVDWAVGQEQPWLDRLVTEVPHFALVASATSDHNPALGQPSSDASS